MTLHWRQEAWLGMTTSFKLCPLLHQKWCTITAFRASEGRNNTVSSAHAMTMAQSINIKPPLDYQDAFMQANLADTMTHPICKYELNTLK